MHVLIVGSGGREHALAWQVAKSPLLTRLSAAPGNPGIADLIKTLGKRGGRCHLADPLDIAGIVKLCGRKDETVDFAVVGPEAPLAAGLVDRLDQAGIKSFGPRRAAAEVETSKAFTKRLCAEAGIPTAAYRPFTDAREAKAYLKTLPGPYVVKADGLAAGKGVIISDTQQEAERAVDTVFAMSAGDAADRPLARAVAIIEEYLDGEEASFFALSDGENVLPLIAAQDHKRAFDGDVGPNTGGMGAYSPTPAFTPAIGKETLTRIVQPAIKRLAERGTPYKGVLFAGLMLTKAGPKLIEFNARFGDPECQVLMLRLKSDLLPALVATHDGGLDKVPLAWHDGAAIAVVHAARGYPGAPERGSVISGLDEAGRVEGVEIFHAGTARRGNDIIAAGGRVLTVCAKGATLEEARARAYRAVDLIDWPQGFCRRDIARRALGGNT